MNTCAGCPVEIPDDHVVCEECRSKPSGEIPKEAALMRRLAAYGQDLDYFWGLWNGQRGACAICRTEFFPHWEAQIDHCHRTGAIRGLLCGRCNRGLGMFGDTPKGLERAFIYLHDFYHAFPKEF